MEENKKASTAAMYAKNDQFWEYETMDTTASNYDC